MDACCRIKAGSIGDSASSRLAWSKIIGDEGTTTPNVSLETDLSSAGVSLTVLEVDVVDMSSDAPGTSAILAITAGREREEVEKSVVIFMKNDFKIGGCCISSWVAVISVLNYTAHPPIIQRLLGARRFNCRGSGQI